MSYRERKRQESMLMRKVGTRRRLDKVSVAGSQPMPLTVVPNSMITEAPYS